MAFPIVKPFQFHTPSSILIVGPSGYGKTVFTQKLLENNVDLFETPPKSIHYCYGAWQSKFAEMSFDFHEGIPELEELDAWFPNGQGILVLDDLMDEGRGINECWISLPNIRIIAILPCCSCVKICFRQENMPKVFHVTRIM